MIGKRRRARAYALQVLYALESGAEDPPQIAVDAYRHHFGKDVDDETLEFAETLRTHGY